MLQQSREKKGSIIRDEQSIIIDVLGLSSIALQIQGTFNATLQFEATVDGTNWDNISLTPIDNSDAVESTTAVGIWTGSCSGFRFIRIRSSAFTSGSVEVSLIAALSGGSSPSSSSGSSSQNLTPTTYTLVVANEGTNDSEDITQTGLTTELIVSAPSINGSGATFQLDILNSAGKLIFSQSGYAESTDHRIMLSRNIVPTDDIKITTSVSVGADKTFTVEVR